MLAWSKSRSEVGLGGSWSLSGRLGHVLGHLGCVLRRLGYFLERLGGALGGVPGASWDRLGLSCGMGAGAPEGILERIGVSWGVLGMSWARFS